jgi:hypothetical protein
MFNLQSSCDASPPALTFFLFHFSSFLIFVSPLKFGNPMKFVTTLILLITAVFFLSHPSSGQVVLEEGFEHFDSFTLDFSPWKVVDVDGSPTYSVVGYDFPHAEDSMAFIVFVPSSTSPPWGYQAIQPHSGIKFAACFADYTPPNNDWLISPPVTLGTGSYITFWVKSYIDMYGLEKYRVAVSTTGNDPADFEFISGDAPLEAPSDMWQQKNFDLSAYNTQTIYLAIQCVSNEAFIFMVDDIVITSDVGIEEHEPRNLTVAPNPTAERIRFQYEDVMKEIRLYDLYGHVLKDIRLNTRDYTMTVDGLATGVYLYKVISLEGVTSGKVVIE